MSDDSRNIDESYQSCSIASIVCDGLRVWACVLGIVALGIALGVLARAAWRLALSF